MALRSCFVVLLALSCSSPPPPQSSDDADQPASDLSEPSSAESSDTPKTDEAPAASSSEPASTADLQAILQLVIDDEALQPYLHLELPERHPLRVSGDALPSGIELRKGEKPAQIVDAAAADDKKKAVLVFTEIQVQGDKATIVYRYDIEKVRGSATVTKSDGAWTLSKSRVTTRDLPTK